jgi:hypothetical protein
MKDDDDVLNYEWDDALRKHTCKYSGIDEAIATAHAHTCIHRIFATCIQVFSASLQTHHLTPNVHVPGIHRPFYLGFGLGYLDDGLFYKIGSQMM